MTIPKQLIYTNKIMRNNPSPDIFTSVSKLASCPAELDPENKHSMLTICYPSCRPLKIYRKQGISCNITQDSSTSCNTECSVNKQIGLPFKLLGKKNNGQSKMCCTDTQGPVDTNNISNGARRMKGTLSSTVGAKIAASVQPTNYLINNNSTPYYSDYLSYIRGRGNTYHAKSTLKKIPGVDYTNPIASEYYETTEGIPCNPNIKTFYKPSNKKFASQGSVSSSTRLQYVKTNTIKINNTSFQSVFNVNLQYQTDPVYFVKNKIEKCSPCLFNFKRVNR